MAVPYSSTKLRVPRGFQNLLEGLAREVLREQPQDIYKFGAEFFSNLLKIRDEEGFDPCAEGAKLEDRFYNNKSFKEKDVDPSDPQQQAAALQIQTEYRRHVADQQVSEMREEAAATSIQAAARGAADRQEARTDAEEEVDIDLNDPQVAEAATKIQAGFKGYKARREIQEMKKAESGSERTEQPQGGELGIEDNAETNAAAAKIQAGFRGHKTRKELSQKMEVKGETGDGADSEAIASQTIDIDPDDPEVVQAATKIQAGYKGMMTRRELKDKAGKAASSEIPGEPEADISEEPQAGQAENIDIDLNDPEVEEAATKIQAGFRGMQARREVAHLKDTASEKVTEPAETSAEAAAEHEKDEAATKIQAAARGYQAQEEKEKLESETTEEAPAVAEGAPAASEEGEEIDIDLNDPEVANAAEKIQAGFKGYKTRKELSKKKEEAGEAVNGEAAQEAADGEASGEKTGDDAAGEAGEQ